MRQDVEFIEEHTALADSEIELEILLECIKRGCDVQGEYKRYRTIPREIPQKFKVIEKFENGENVTEYDFIRKTYSKEKNQIILKKGIDKP